MDLVGFSDITVTKEDISDYEPIRPYTGEINFTMDVEVSDEFKEKLLAKKLIAKEIFLGLPFKSKILDLEFMQNRIHIGKRINKKWARKYGYTCTVYYR